MADNSKRTGAAVEAHYQFLLWLGPTLEKFPKDKRFTLGDRIMGHALDVLDALIEATYTRDRIVHLRRANLGIEKLRFLLRLATDLKVLDRRRSMPGKAKSGRGLFPFNANQFHVAGFTSPFGSQNDDAGTRQRRSSNEPRQKLLERTLSSRTLVTRRGARPCCSSTKPQRIGTSSRSPSLASRTTGAV